VEEGLQKAEQRRYTAEDVTLLEKALVSLKEAMGNETWRALAVRKQDGLEQVSSQEMGIIPHVAPNSSLHT
jgi:hypothetical protein